MAEPAAGAEEGEIEKTLRRVEKSSYGKQEEVREVLGGIQQVLDGFTRKQKRLAAWAGYGTRDLQTAPILGALREILDSKKDYSDLVLKYLYTLKNFSLPFYKKVTSLGVLIPGTSVHVQVTRAESPQEQRVGKRDLQILKEAYRQLKRSAPELYAEAESETLTIFLREERNVTHAGAMHPSYSGVIYLTWPFQEKGLKAQDTVMAALVHEPRHHWFFKEHPPWKVLTEAGLKVRFGKREVSKLTKQRSLEDYLPEADAYLTHIEAWFALAGTLKSGSARRTRLEGWALHALDRVNETLAIIRKKLAGSKEELLTPQGLRLLESLENRSIKRTARSFLDLILGNFEFPPAAGMEANSPPVISASLELSALQRKTFEEVMAEVSRRLDVWGEKAKLIEWMENHPGQKFLYGGLLAPITFLFGPLSGGTDIPLLASLEAGFWRRSPEALREISPALQENLVEGERGGFEFDFTFEGATVRVHFYTSMGSLWVEARDMKSVGPEVRVMAALIAKLAEPPFNEEKISEIARAMGRIYGSDVSGEISSFLRRESSWPAAGNGLLTKQRKMGEARALLAVAWLMAKHRMDGSKNRTIMTLEEYLSDPSEGNRLDAVEILGREQDLEESKAGRILQEGYRLLQFSAGTEEPTGLRIFFSKKYLSPHRVRPRVQEWLSGVIALRGRGDRRGAWSQLLMLQDKTDLNVWEKYAVGLLRVWWLLSEATEEDPMWPPQELVDEAIEALERFRVHPLHRWPDLINDRRFFHSSLASAYAARYWMARDPEDGYVALKQIDTALSQAGPGELVSNQKLYRLKDTMKEGMGIRFAAGAEQLAVAQRMDVLAEAMPGRQVLAVQASEISRRAGMEEFFARMPRGVRLKKVVLGAESLAGLELPARGDVVYVNSDAPADWGVALAGLEAERVVFLGEQGAGNLLRRILPEMQITVLSPGAGMEQVLLSLGLSSDLLGQINAAGVEQLLASEQSA